jgi:integrase
MAWLNAYIAKGGSTTGKVVTLSFGVLRAKRRTNWTTAAGENVKWTQQGMRHTYCSNWLAKHEDVNKLVLQSGHDSVDTMWRNYHRGTRKEEAEKFWAIAPPSDPAADKIVAFAS